MKQLAIETEIIKAFRKASDEFVSGELLANSIGVSRAAVWKHINALRKKGYEIEAVPKMGYKLMCMPDILLA
ncbi:MAG: biotin operon repressor, partial [Rubrobacteridae bacterium]|nr:biotin operon repressor [Rubrobacteridae bacterium]